MIQLIPYCRSALWGGNRIKPLFAEAQDLPNLAEAWLFSVCPEQESLAEHTPLSDWLLAQGYHHLLSKLPLVKLLDTASLLSVQVHPNDEQAERLEGKPCGKSEMWYILHAQEGAYIYHNLECSKAEFLLALEQKQPTKALKKHYVKAGEVYMIPAGMVHALGGGITLLEIQQSSDTTYRLWDYERKDDAGNLRPLHIEKATEVLRPFREAEIQAFQYAEDAEKFSVTYHDALSNVSTIAKTPLFRVDICEVSENKPCTFSTPKHPLAIISLSDEGVAKNRNQTLALTFGATLCVLPQDGEVNVSGEGRFAVVSMPCTI